MTDDLERTLRRYAVKGPSAALRARVLTRAPRTVPLGLLDYLFAAAAALVLTVSSLTPTMTIDVPRSAADQVREDNVRVLASLIGEGDEAYAVAESLVPPSVDSEAVEEEGR